MLRNHDGLRTRAEHRADPLQDGTDDRLADPEAGLGGDLDGGTRLATDSFTRPSFTLEQIRTFLTVASRQHVTNAAKVLGLTQPAVSQQVQMLERALGFRLVERSGRGIRLTEGGLEVASTCLLIMRSIESLERVAEELRGLGRGSLEIGASQVTANYYLSRALAAFTVRHPMIKVNIRISDTQNVCEMLASGELHCGLVDAPLPDTNLACVPVGTDEVIFVARRSNPLAGVDSISGRELDAVRYLVWGPTSATEAIAAEVLGPLYHRLAKVRLSGLEAARQALLTDDCYIAAMPCIAVSAAVKDGPLARLRVKSITRPICAVRRQGASSPSVEAFWQELTTGPSPILDHGPRATGPRTDGATSMLTRHARGQTESVADARYPALVQDDGTHVGNLQFLLTVAGHHDGRSLLNEFLDGGEHHLGRAVVQMRSWLVKQQ
jgi:DNA-binding transcriptional LysR family regulator